MYSSASGSRGREVPTCGGLHPCVRSRGHKKPSGQGWARDLESVRALRLPMATLAVATARSRGRRVVAHAPILRQMTHPNALLARRRFRCALAEVAAGRAQTSRGGSVAPDNARYSGHRRWSRLMISCHSPVGAGAVLPLCWSTLWQTGMMAPEPAIDEERSCQGCDGRAVILSPDQRARSAPSADLGRLSASSLRRVRSRRSSRVRDRGL